MNSEAHTASFKIKIKIKTLPTWAVFFVVKNSFLRQENIKGHWYTVSIMYKISIKPILVTVLVLAMCVGAAWFLMRPEVQEKSGVVVAPPEISPTPVAFISPETGESLLVTFGTSTALISGNGYSNVLLTQVEVVSGAKYESSTENLVLVSEGSEVTLQRGRKIIFTGRNQEEYLPSDAATSSVSVTATTSDITNLSGTYVWIETVKENRTIVPKAPGVFSVTFADGAMSGTTDCNGFSGSYTEENGALSVGALAMTKMFCEGSQEMEYTQQFVGELTIEREGRTLFLVHADGTRNQFEAKE